jgi:hypothetical protein
VRQNHCIIGHDALRRRDTRPLLNAIRDDEARIRDVRELAS